MYIIFFSKSNFSDSTLAAYSVKFAVTPDSSQFHQHFANSFCANILLPKIYKAKLRVRKAVQNTFVQKSCL